MKKIIFPLFILIAFFTTLQQALAVDSYWIVFLKGNVFKTDSDKPLKLGDKITADQKLRFGQKDAYMVVMGPKGKFTLKPEINKAKPNEFMAFVNSALLPVKTTGRLSTRGEESGISDLGTYFGEDSFAIIGNTHPVKLNPKNYELNDTKYLIYRYETTEGVISKKIAFNGNDILLDKKALYIDKTGKEIDPGDVKKVEIYRFDASLKSSSKIAAFKPVFMEEEVLKEQLLSVYKICKEELNSDATKTEDELIKFVLDLYGRTDEAILKNWLKENIIR